MQDSNLRRHCHQIYSLTPLTARETPRTRLLKVLLKVFVGNRSCQIASIERNMSHGLPKQQSVPKQQRDFRYELAEGLEPTTC